MLSPTVDDDAGAVPHAPRLDITDVFVTPALLKASSIGICYVRYINLNEALALHHE